MRKKIALWLSQKRQVPYRLRKSVIKKICPSLLTSHPFEINFYGLRYVGNTAHATDRLFFMFGGCEHYMLSLLKNYSLAVGREDIVFLDVGAHTGNHALFMSRYARNVYAFEPNPEVRDLLEAHVTRNGLGNVQVYPFGLGNTNETLPFYVPAQDAVSCGSFCKGHDARNEKIGELQVRAGDEVLKEQGITRVDIIKIDVEGFEKNVMEGLKETLSRCRPLVILELSGTTRAALSGKEAFEAMFPNEYVFYQFSGVSRERAHYRLAGFDYGLHEHHLDVIAIPKEKQSYFSNYVVERVKRNKVIGG